MKTNLEKLFDFLKKLKENNNRTWFNEHKDEYLQTKETFEKLIETLLVKISRFDEHLEGVSPKQCIFRIYRDIRFSKDKTLYKTHFGAVLASGGRKSPYAGFYLHLEPGNSFVGAGVYAPRPEILKALREKIFREPERFLKILNAKDFPKLLEKGKLKRIPKGFPRDFPYADLLKYKHYVASVELPEDFWKQENFIDRLTELYRFFLPFNNFLNEAVSEALKEEVLKFR